MDKIMELAAALGQAIKADEKMRRMEEANDKYNSDEALCAVVGEYNALSQSLSEAYGKGEGNTDAAKAIEARMTDLYNEITEHPLMKEYQEAQAEVNELMNKVNEEITFQITGERPSACSGDCHSCGGHCSH